MISQFTLKQCSDCHKSFTLHEFYFSKGKPLKRCKDCHNLIKKPSELKIIRGNEMTLQKEFRIR